jgi:hypothetical protein
MLQNTPSYLKYFVVPEDKVGNYIVFVNKPHYILVEHMGKQIKYSVPLLKSRQASVEEIEFRTINETRDQAIKNIIQMERMGPVQSDTPSVSDCTGCWNFS